MSIREQALRAAGYAGPIDASGFPVQDLAPEASPTLAYHEAHWILTGYNIGEEEAHRILLDLEELVGPTWTTIMLRWHHVLVPASETLTYS